MTTPNGSDSGLSSLIGESWVRDGYPVSPIFDDFEPCIICGAPNSTCTGHEFAYQLGDTVPGYDIPPTDSEASGRSYFPGTAPRAERYDIPQGSQGQAPYAEPAPLEVDSDISIYTDSNNPDTSAIVEGAADLAPWFVAVPANEVEVDEYGFVYGTEDE